MFLLISANGQVLGQTFSADNAKRHAIVARDTMFIVLRESCLDNLPLEVQAGLFEEYGVDTVKKLWLRLKKQNFPYWGKISVQRIVRHFFKEEDGDAAYTKQELLDTIPGATWISITTAITMLKRTKTSRGKTMDVRFVNSKYRRVA